MTRVRLARAVLLLKQGKVVAIPTDTAYGLAALATDTQAIQRVKQLKGRDKRKPIALIASSLKQVERFFILTKTERRLARRWWPGPLTLLLRPKKHGLAAASLTANQLIGVRVPARASARQAAEQCGCPLTATSANRSGQPTCYTDRDVARTFPALPILAAGRLKRWPVSTIVRVKGRQLQILRPGPIDPQK